MNHIFELQLTIPSFTREQKKFLKSLGKRFEKHHNRETRQNNADGYKMTPFIECLQTRFLSKDVCKLIDGNRKIYIVFRLYHETKSEQNMAVHQLKKEMRMWREDLQPAVAIQPVKSYKELYYSNAFMILYCKFSKWAQEKEPELTAMGNIIYSL
jgi:hypothetical protein